MTVNSTVTADAAVANAVQVAASAVKRGLGERGILDVKTEEIHILIVLLLAKVGELDEELSSVYALFDVLEEASCLQLPSEADFDRREGELQRLLTLLHETPSIKAQRGILVELGKALLKRAPSKQLSFAMCPQPWQLWRIHYGKSNAPPKRNTKPPPLEPNNVWFHLTPDRSPMDVPRNILSKLFKKWMLANHPDKGGDEEKCARVSSLYSQAMARGMNASGANPDEHEKVDEDAVYRQQQLLAEPEFSAYKRAVNERAYCSSATYLEQRLLKAARWMLTRRERQETFCRECAKADAEGPEAVARAVPTIDTAKAAGTNSQQQHGGAGGGGAARDSSPRSVAPAMAFGKRAEPHSGAMRGAATNTKGFFSPAFGGQCSPTKTPPMREPLRPVQGPTSDIVFMYSTADGEGLTSAFPKQVGRFTIRARDRLFRAVPCSIEPFHVVVRGKQIVAPTTTANKDGSIGVEYSIAVCGTYKVHIRGGKKGTHVLGSPFTLVVKAAPVQPCQCAAEGSGLRRARAGEASSFTLHRRDVNGQLIAKGTSRFVIAFGFAETDKEEADKAKEARGAYQGAAATKELVDKGGTADSYFTTKVVDKGDGTFNVSYTTQRAGSYKLHVTLGLANPVEIHGSPFELHVGAAGIAAPACELTDPLAAPLGRGVRAEAKVQRGADGDIRVSAVHKEPDPIVAGKPFYLRVLAKDALGNEVSLVPEGSPAAMPSEASSSSSSAALADFKATLTAASGRSLPANVVRLPCGQLEVRAVAFAAEAHTLHVTYQGTAIRRSARHIIVLPGPLDLRHVTTLIEACEAGRVMITATARDVYGNKTGANLLGCAILPHAAAEQPPTTEGGLGDRLEPPRPYAPPIRRGADKAELAAAVAAAAASRAGTHAAMVQTVRAVFQPEDADVPETGRHDDAGTRAGCSGKHSSEGVLPPEWKMYLDKREERRVNSTGVEARAARRDSVEVADGVIQLNGSSDVAPPSPLKYQRENHATEEEEVGSAGSSSSGINSSQWFSGRGDSMRALVKQAGGWELPSTMLVDASGEQRGGRCQLVTHELTKAGSYWLLLWAENHAGDPANPERASANVDDLTPPGDKGARIVLLRTLVLSPGPFSLRHSQVRMPQQMEPPRAGQSFGLGILSFDKFGNPLRTGGNVKLSLKTLVGPPPSPLPVQPPPMTSQHIDHMDGMHEVRITTFRAGDHQLVLTATNASGGVQVTNVGGSNAENGANGGGGSGSAVAVGRVLRLRVVAAELDPSKCVLKPLGADGLAVSATFSVSADRRRGGGAADSKRLPIPLRAGQWTSALLQCSDTYGNLRPAIQAIASGLQLELIEGLDEQGSPLPPSQLRSEQRLNADGSIWLRYAPLGCGPRSLSVRMQDVHVVGSPLRLEVAAGALQLRACELVGDGRRLCHQHEKASFKIITKDGYGNQLQRGGERFAVMINREGDDGLPDVLASVTDAVDGSYQVEYTCESQGGYSVSVFHGTKDGDELPGSPFALKCLPGSAHLPSCKFVGAHHGVRALMPERDLESADRLSLGTVGACGSKLKVQVRLVDRVGHPTRMSNPKSLMLALLPEPRKPVGDAELFIFPDARVDRKQAAKAYEQALHDWVDTRWKVVTAGVGNGASAMAASFAPAAAVSSEDGIRVVGANVPVCFEGAVLCCLERASGSPPASGGSDGAEHPTEDNGEVREGLHDAQLELRRVGRYRLALVGSNGHAIGPPLVMLEVGAGRAHAASCAVGGEALDKGFVGQPLDFWLKAYDAAGNAIDKGGEKVVVKVVGAPGGSQQMPKVTVRDDGNGTYGLKFVPAVAGAYTLAVMLGREQVGTALPVTVYRSPTSAANALKHLGVPPLPTGAPPGSARGEGPDGLKGSARGPSPLPSARRNSSTPRTSVRSSSPRGGAPGSSTPRAGSPRPGPIAAPSAEPPTSMPSSRRAQSPRPSREESRREESSKSGKASPETSPREGTVGRVGPPQPSPSAMHSRVPPLPMGRASPLRSRDRDEIAPAPVSAREVSHSSLHDEAKPSRPRGAALGGAGGGGGPSCVPPLRPTGHAIFDRGDEKSDVNNIATKRAESARSAPRRSSTPRAGSPRAPAPATFSHRGERHHSPAARTASPRASPALKPRVVGSMPPLPTGSAPREAWKDTAAPS